MPKYACGHVKGFSMGFGYSDPLAKCRACNERRQLLGCLAYALLPVVIALAAVLLR